MKKKMAFNKIKLLLGVSLLVIIIGLDSDFKTAIVLSIWGVGFMAFNMCSATLYENLRDVNFNFKEFCSRKDTRIFATTLLIIIISYLLWVPFKYQLMAAVPTLMIQVFLILYDRISHWWFKRKS